ncbi:hypothetical protein PAMP_006174 [Pampus punctatissimus]
MEPHTHRASVSAATSLDGFVFALNREGRFLYISETVSIYLGLSQRKTSGESVSL